MKKSRTRQRSHRTSTPSVICLPPPKPPVSAPRKEPEVERAMKLPSFSEPLVTAESSSTRQLRRKARRAEAKSTKRKGVAVTYQTAAKVDPLPETPQPETQPLPRNRALARQPSGVMAKLNAWFARLVPVRAARPPASFDRCTPEALAEQMAALRAELAQVQGRLDRMISAVSPRL